MARPEAIAELEAMGKEEVEQPSLPLEQAPTQEAPPVAAGPEFEYFLGQKSSKLPGTAEFVIKHDGKPVRIPASKLINEYRQSAHLQKKLEELGKLRSEWEPKVKEYDTLQGRMKELEPYQKLQEWSIKRPEAFEYVMQNMQMDANGLLSLKPPGEGVATAAPDTSGLNKTIEALRAELDGLKQWKTSQEERAKEAEIQEDVKTVEREIADYQEQLVKKGFDIKLDEADEDGISLKAHIIKFGIDNQIPDFKTAANSFLHDTLLERAVERGRTEAVKGVKGDAKAGIIGRSSTPSVGQSKVDPRKLGPSERREAALAELLASEAGGST